MKTRTTIAGRLFNYSCLSAGFIALHTGAAGQVHYNNIDPDELLQQWPNEDEGMKYADLDDDGFTDIGLHFDSGYNCGYCPGWVFFHVELFDDTEIATAMGEACTGWSTYSSTCYFPSVEVADVFVDGDILTTANQFGVIENIFQVFGCGYPYGWGCGQGFFSSPYGPVDEQFLGFRKTGIDTNLCWLRLYWDDHALYLTGTACETQPNTSIEMQHIPDVVLENEEFDTPEFDIVFSNNAIQIHSDDVITDAELTIYDIEGKKYYLNSFSGTDLIIPVDYANGIYIIQIQSPTIQFTQKILLQ